MVKYYLSAKLICLLLWLHRLSDMDITATYTGSANLLFLNRANITDRLPYLSNIGGKTQM